VASSQRCGKYCEVEDNFFTLKAGDLLIAFHGLFLPFNFYVVFSKQIWLGSRHEPECLIGCAASGSEQIILLYSNSNNFSMVVCCVPSVKHRKHYVNTIRCWSETVFHLVSSYLVCCTDRGQHYTRHRSGRRCPNMK